jgi:Aspartyl protease/Tetratricopeptide repeat
MKPVRICIALAVILAPYSLPGPATSQPKPPEIDAATQLFQAGKFAEAGKLYSRLAAENPQDYTAILQLARIALLSDRLDDAQKWLDKAITLQSGGLDAKVMLAEVFYRRDDFQKAAASLKGVEVSSNKLVASQYPTLNVAKLESFKGQTPYEVQGNGQSTRLTFLKTDPLPVVSVRVNGGDAVTFFIDTGGSEVALDTDFARELGVPQFGAVQGTFAGGQHAEVQNGRIESLTVGDWTVKNLPVAMLALRPTLPNLWREPYRWHHRDQSAVPFPCDPRLSARRACAAAENRDKSGAVCDCVIRQTPRGSFLDCGRPLHGRLGSCRNAPTCAPLR